MVSSGTMSWWFACFADAFSVVTVVDRNDCSVDIDGAACFSAGSNLGSKNVRATPIIIPIRPSPMENFVSLICFFTIASLKSLCTLNARILHSFSARISYCNAAPLASACHLESSWSDKAERSSVSSIYNPFAKTAHHRHRTTWPRSHRIKRPNVCRVVRCLRACAR